MTIALDAAADRPVSSWSVSSLDLSGTHDHKHYVDVALDRSIVVAGDTVRLTITARRSPPKGICIVGVVSTRGETSHVWPIAVVTP
ncbi:MAG: hypothetical protein ABIT71_08480 [Vicinamibacteraceae bacterium]